MSANVQSLLDTNTPPEPVVIRYLADCPQHIPVIATWIFDYWGKSYGFKSLQDQINALSRRLYRNRIPLALVAFSGSRPVGTASLKIQEMPMRKQFYYWLGSVYVIPEFRGRGIGRSLVTRCETVAAEIGVTDLFLHTPDKQGFYRKLNWNSVEKCIYHDMSVVIMKKSLPGPIYRYWYDNSGLNLERRHVHV